MMNNPKELKYTKSHEWVKFLEDSTAQVGLTDHAQHEMGDLVFVNLPDIGDTVTMGESFGEVESVKAVSDIFSPASGLVFAVNEEVKDEPQLINSDPYGAWLIGIKEISEKTDLMDYDAYERFLQEDE